MPFKYATWPHLDIGSLPQIVRRFLLGTIVASLYTGIIVLVLVARIAVSDILRLILDSGISEVASITEEIGKLIRDATAPA